MSGVLLPDFMSRGGFSSGSYFAGREREKLANFGDPAMSKEFSEEWQQVELVKQSMTDKWKGKWHHSFCGRGRWNRKMCASQSQLLRPSLPCREGAGAAKFPALQDWEWEGLSTWLPVIWGSSSSRTLTPLIFPCKVMQLGRKPDVSNSDS